MGKKLNIKEVLIEHGHISCMSVTDNIIRMDCSACSFYYTASEEAWTYQSFQDLIINEWERFHLVTIVDRAAGV